MGKAETAETDGCDPHFPPLAAVPPHLYVYVFRMSLFGKNLNNLRVETEQLRPIFMPLFVSKRKAVAVKCG